MHDNTTQRGDDLRSLIKKLQNVDVESVNENEALKIETLDLARKITAALEGPVNRATDLMYRVRILSGVSRKVKAYTSKALCNNSGPYRSGPGPLQTHWISFRCNYFQSTS